jgi:hypothetical protein
MSITEFISAVSFCLSCISFGYTICSKRAKIKTTASSSKVTVIFIICK